MHLKINTYKEIIEKLFIMSITFFFFAYQGRCSSIASIYNTILFMYFFITTYKYNRYIILKSL